MTVLFPDTNVFVECRNPAKCPWAEVTKDPEITLVVCCQIRSEIDNLKSSARGRKADRAKAWTAARFREASRTGGHLVLRPSNPKVLLVLPPPAPPLEPMPALLDPTRPDDRVIQDILALKQSDPGLADGLFLTDDGGAADMAKHVGLNAVEIPLDGDNPKRSWRLPRELDAADKRIKELERLLIQQQAKSPVVTILARDPTGASANSLLFPLMRFEPLSEVKC